MKINRQELLTALETVKPGLARNEDIEQTSNFAFMKGRLVTYNDEISINYPIKGVDFDGAVPATELYQFISKCKTDELDIDHSGESITIISGKAKAVIAIQAKITLPVEEIGKIKEWKPLPDTFHRHLSFALGSCGKDQTRNHFILTCVHVNGNCIEASDGFRITQCNAQSAVPVKEFLLPSSVARQVLSLAASEIAESDNQNWIHFRKEQTVLSCRIIDEKFPNVTPFLKVEGEAVEFPESISDVIDRAWVFTKRALAIEEMITVVLKDKRMIVRSENEIAKFEEEVRLRYTGKDIEFFITPYLLKDILKETRSCLIGKDRIRFEQNDWVYLSLLRS
jgi:DNA polymerase III sliding clamp (beta) subunit (PCNA family)